MTKVHATAHTDGSGAKSKSTINGKQPSAASIQTSNRGGAAFGLGGSRSGKWTPGTSAVGFSSIPRSLH